MPRNMSFALTTDQVRAQAKTVTRRRGWWFLKPGDLVQPVVKGMGLKRGEKVECIGAPVRIVSTRPEPLCAITASDVIREGFPDWTPEQFVAMFCHHNRCAPGEIINRIEFDFS